MISPPPYFALAAFRAVAPFYIMKHSQTIGFLLSLLLIAICFFPWSTLPERHIVMSGMNTAGTHYGRPGLMNIFFSSFMAVMFLVQKLWAKRANLFFGALNMAWSVRNYIIVSACYAGDCPEKQPGVYALVAVASLMLLMVFLPKIETKPKPRTVNPGPA